MAEEHEHKEHHEHKEEHKEEHKLELPRRRRKNQFWMIASAVLFALLIISMFTSGFTSLFKGGGTQLSAQQAGENAINYINDVLLQGQSNATLGAVTDAGNGLYNAKLNVGGQIFDAYITKDGKLLFPQAIDLTTTPTTTTPTTTQTTTSCADITQTDKPVVQVFYMAFCPYGIQAMTGMYPVAKLFGDKVDIQPHYVIYEDYQGGSADYCANNGTICSMHGINELNEDMRQACIYKYQTDKFWDYTNCVMTTCSVSNVATCWETCADKYSVDKTQLNDCVTNEGADLMTAEKQLDAQKGVEGSPTIFINGADYSGGRAPDNFKTIICCGFNTQPSECNQNLTTGTTAASGNCG